MGSRTRWAHLDCRPGDFYLRLQVSTIVIIIIIIKRERALSRLRSRLSRDGQSADSEKFLLEDIIDFIMGAGGETSLNLPCLLILASHLSCHLAFPLLLVGAAGDEGDTV